MLGGSLLEALLRNSLGYGMILIVFLILDHPRLPAKHTRICYIFFFVFSVMLFSLWYLYSPGWFVRLAGLVVIFVAGVFCVLMSRDSIYLSCYKLSLGFYFMTITVVFGVDGSRIFFSSNPWADIILRYPLAAGIILIVWMRLRPVFMENGEYLREMDLGSSITVVLSLLITSFLTFWPDSAKELSAQRIARIVVLLFLAGIIQMMVFHIYLHRGKEKRYRTEKELLEINEQLLRNQLELMQESQQEAARIRHDARHHCLMIAEYIQQGKTDKLWEYVQEYQEDIGKSTVGWIGGNETVNGVLSIYARRAQKKNIEVSIQVDSIEDLAMRDIDLVALIANVFENAIHGCVKSKHTAPQIHLTIHRREKKVVFQCRNTCSKQVRFHNGIPTSDSGSGIGVSSIMKIASYYHGEVDFAVKDGMFIARILWNISKAHLTPHANGLQ